MADYYSPTVVQQLIPVADMTPLERLVLSLVFETEPDGDVLYLYSSLGPSDAIVLSIDNLRTALDASSGKDSVLASHVRKRLTAAPPDDTEIDLEFDELSWSELLQDIVRRSPTLDYISVVSAFTCSRMRPDGFGGGVVLITADAIHSRSTPDILDELLASRGKGGG
ncbi:hypothetical protein [Hyphomicrobium sp.]|uniref:hypothetical protein n=1 Tax=Hyphomicrobium sp. TaxID=82 RepID=UPI002FE0D8AD